MADVNIEIKPVREHWEVYINGEFAYSADTHQEAVEEILKGEKQMTCRDKLKIEYPESVSNDFVGGCAGCPSSYGYLDNPSFCTDDLRGAHRTNACVDCWDREIPEEKPAPTYPVEKATDGYIDPVHITIHTDLIDDPANVIAEVFKYAYTIKDRVVNISIQ
jgi:hypothetical protein